MRHTVEILKGYGLSPITVNGRLYMVHMYSDGFQGNILRKDDTVLTRYYMTDSKIKFAFQKERAPYEFDYTTYGIDLDEELEAVKRIPNVHAEELYDVLLAIKDNI